MKKILLPLILLCLPLCTWGQGKGYSTQNMMPEVKPGDNFVKYATGNWTATHPLRDDQHRNGAFVDCQDSVNARLGRILTDLLTQRQEPNSIGDKLRTVYQQYSDTAQRNADGIRPLQPYLQEIRQAKSVAELQQVMARLDQIGVNASLVNWAIGPDMAQADSNIVMTTWPGLLIHSNYHFGRSKKTRAVRQAFMDYGRSVFETIGYTPQEAGRRAQKAYDIEHALANAYRQMFASSEYKDLIHKISPQQLRTDYPAILWTTLFSSGNGPMDVRIVNVTNKKSLRIANRLLQEGDLEALKSHTELRLLYAFAPYMTQTMRRQRLDFEYSMIGKKADEPLKTLSAMTLSQILNMPMGKLYCDRFFTAESRERMRRIAEQIRQTFRERLEHNTWMTPTTRQAALHKLDQMQFLVGYPDQWPDFNQLDIRRNKSLVDNIASIKQFDLDESVKQGLNRKVDPNYWTNPPQTVNAFYSPSKNIMVLPAGILQPPFFDPEADEAINYGAIGVVIGHELTHGYDRSGSQFDSKGNVHNWWKRADRRAFKRRTRVLARHFNHQRVHGKKVNGWQTLNENIADNGGLNIAMQAMQQAGVNRTIGGFNAQQLFLLSYARMYARNNRMAFLEFLLKNDPHAPNETRVNGALPHIDAWYEAFDIQPSDSLYLPADKRARIW
ncbi:MAG: M13 family metallopeptidase [Bacteroidales bacterium]|nr:M13 family metallopeptidase [Bacteroidales bacterium]